MAIADQMEIAVYISALQRHMHAPRAIDLRRLNRVIRWAQRHPRGLTYRRLPEPRVLLAVGDSAFQAPAEAEIAAGKDPLVMRGYILAWVHRINLNEPNNMGSCEAGGGYASARICRARGPKGWSCWFPPNQTSHVFPPVVALQPNWQPGLANEFGG